MKDEACQKFITTKKAKEALGVNEATLRRWADNGLFPSYKSPKGTRYYQVDQFLKTQSETDKIESNSKQKICYCRVSSKNQKDDLQRQTLYMQTAFPKHRIITDIGSGINFKRPGLRTILELAGKGDVEEVVVAYRDRLCRFAFELIEWILQTNDVKLLVLHEAMDSSEQSELAEDLLAIINVFNCRVNGKRKYKKEKTKQSAKEATGEQSEKSGSETNS